MAWGERSSLVLPLGFHGPLCMHCSAAVWYFSLLAAAAALGASASAGLVAPCWKFWSIAVACFNIFLKCSRFPFLAKTGFFGSPLNKEISLLSNGWRNEEDVVIRRYVENWPKIGLRSR